MSLVLGDYGRSRQGWQTRGAWLDRGGRICLFVHMKRAPGCDAVEHTRKAEPLANKRPPLLLWRRGQGRAAVFSHLGRFVGKGQAFKALQKAWYDMRPIAPVALSWASNPGEENLVVFSPERS